MAYNLTEERLKVMDAWFKSGLSEDIPTFSNIYSFEDGEDVDTYEIDFPEGTFKDGLHLSVNVEVEFYENSSQVKDMSKVSIHNGGDEGFTEKYVEKNRLSNELINYLNIDNEQLSYKRLETMKKFFKDNLSSEIPNYVDIYSFEDGEDNDTYQIEFPPNTFDNNLNLSVNVDVKFRKNSTKYLPITKATIHNGGEEGFEEVTVSLNKLSSTLSKYLKHNLDEGEFLTENQIEKLKQALIKYHKKLPGYIDGYDFKYSSSESTENNRYVIFDTIINDVPGHLSIINTIYLNNTNKVSKIELYLMYENGSETIEKELTEKNCWKYISKILRENDILTESHKERYNKYINDYHKKLPGYIEGNVAEFEDFEDNRITFNTFIKDSKNNLSIISTINLNDSGGIKKIDLHLLDDSGEVDESISPDKCWKKVKVIKNRNKELTQEEIKKYEKALNSWHSKLPGFIEGNEVEFSEYMNETKELIFNTSVKDSENGISIVTTAKLDDSGKFKKIGLYLIDDNLLDKPVSKEKCWVVIRQEEPALIEDNSKIKNNKNPYSSVLKENNSNQSLERLNRINKGFTLTKGQIKTQFINHEKYGKVLEVKAGSLNYLLSHAIIVDLNDDRIVYDFRKEVDLGSSISQELKLKNLDNINDNKHFNYIFNVYIKCRDLRRNNEDYLVELSNKLYGN